jgi:hypothetical protein
MPQDPWSVVSIDGKPTQSTEPQPSQAAPSAPTPSDPWEVKSIGDQSVAPATTQPPAPPAPTATISAVHQPTTFLGKFGRWAENVSNDIKYGTDETGIGTVLKKLGAHGVYNGNAEAIGDFMASLPLGLLKAAKGTSELAPAVIGGEKGRTWQGVKDVVGGGLQAVEIPSAFVAPEAGEIAAEGAGKAASAAGRAASAVKEATAIRKAPVLDALKQIIRETANTTADESQVAQPEAKSIVKTVEELADNVFAKSKEQYRLLDEATGGRVQRFTDRLQNIQRQLRELTGTEEDAAKEGKLLQAQHETETAMEEAFEDAKKSGVDARTVDEASANFKKAQALYDLDSTVKKVTTGMRPDIGETASAVKNPETINAEKFFDRVNKLHQSGRLQEALGETGADNLLTRANDAVVQMRRVTRNQKIAVGAAKKVAGGAATALGAGGLYEAGKALLH